MWRQILDMLKDKIKSLTDLTWIKNKLFAKPDTILGINIGNSYVKIVEIKEAFGELSLKSIGSSPLFGEKYTEEMTRYERVASAITHLLELNGIAARDVVLSLGGRDVFERQVVFPKMLDAELAEAVKWDIEKYVPYESDTYYYDFSVIETSSNEEEVSVMLVAAQKTTVDELVTLMESLNLHIIAIEGESFALARTIKDESNYIVVDIGKENGRILIYQEDVPIATRNIPLFGDSFTEAIQTILSIDVLEAERLKEGRQGLMSLDDAEDDNYQRLAKELDNLAHEFADEILRTIEYYRVQNKDAIFDKIFLTGGGARLNGLAEHMSNYISIPIVGLNPFVHLQINDSFDPNYIKNVSVQFSIAIGLAMRGNVV